MPEQAAPRSYRLADLIDEGFDEASAAHDAFVSGKPRGPRVAIAQKLDRELAGFLPVGLTVVAGPPGSGKSAFVDQLAADAGCPAVIASLEQRPLEILNRLAARASVTPLWKFHRGDLSPTHWLECVRKAAIASPSLWILDGTRSPISVPTIQETATIARGDAPHLLLVVDSLHSLVRGFGTGDAASEYDLTSSALASLQALANELKAAIVVVAEQNRASLNAKSNVADLHSAASTRAFEYVAEVFLTLSRDWDAIPDAEKEVPVTLRVVKNRRGAAGVTVPLKFCGERMSFRDAGEDATVTTFTSRRRRA